MGLLVAVPIPRREKAALCRLYVRSGHQVRPLVEAILRHPLLLEGPRMVSPPVVFCAGLLRALGRTIITDDWSWIADLTGQRLFLPPNVAGWDYEHWLDTSRWAGRFTAINYALQGLTLNPDRQNYPSTETAEQAVDAALHFWGEPAVSDLTRESLLTFSRQVARSITADWEQVTYRVLRQNALRALIPTTPDWQAS